MPYGSEVLKTYFVFLDLSWLDHFTFSFFEMVKILNVKKRTFSAESTTLLRLQTENNFFNI